MSRRVAYVDSDTLDLMVAHRDGCPCAAVPLSSSQNPLVRAMSDQDREIWGMLGRGLLQRDIADMLGVDKRWLSRRVLFLREWIALFVRAREIILEAPAMRSRFLREDPAGLAAQAEVVMRAASCEAQRARRMGRKASE